MQHCVLFERFLSSPDAGKGKANDIPRVRLRACVFRKQRVVSQYVVSSYPNERWLTACVALMSEFSKLKDS